MTIDLTTIVLAEGQRIERIYWAAVHAYGYTEANDQGDAESVAATRLGYGGTVELRVVISHDSGSTDTPLVRYNVPARRCATCDGEVRYYTTTNEWVHTTGGHYDHEATFVACPSGICLRASGHKGNHTDDPRLRGK